MRKLFSLALLFISFFSFSQSKAQVKALIIANEEIGNLKCNYLKMEHPNLNTEYCVQIIYKNQQFVYKQEQDTIQLKSKLDIVKLISDLKLGLAVINDEDKDVNIDNSNYTIFKNKGYTDNNFIVIANKQLTIKSPINKFFTNQLISWLNSIDFGKG